MPATSHDHDTPVASGPPLDDGRVLSTVEEISAHVSSRLRVDYEDMGDAMTALRECVLAWESYRLQLATFLGVSVNESIALSYLVSRGPMSVSQLQAAMGFTSGAATLIVDRLVTKQLVEKVPDPQDRRRAIVQALPGPQQHLHEVSRWISVVFTDMDRAEIESTATSLRSIAARFSGMADLVGRAEQSYPRPRRRL